MTYGEWIINTGKQPVGDGVVVQVLYSHIVEGSQEGPASYFNWSRSIEPYIVAYRLTGG